MSARPLLAVIVALAVTVPVLAGDIVAMPTGNIVQPHNVELNGIYWNLPPSSGPADYVTVGELFVGVIDRVEIDWLYADVKDVDEYNEVNVYLTLIKETPHHPSLIVGATNVTEEDWLNGSDDISAFALGSYNLAVPEQITWRTPLVRAHFGWGDEFHGDTVMAGIQAKVSPTFGFAWTNYRRQPGYMATWAPVDWAEVTIGTIGGDVFYRAGAFLKW